MGLLSIFRRKEEKKTTESTRKSLLEELCKGDTELLSILSHTILLNPWMLTKEGTDTFIKKAQEFEDKKDFLRARVNYQVAGEIALYEGKLAQVQNFFKKCAELESDPKYKKVCAYFFKKANAEKALKIAQEYYAQKLKSTEKTEA